MTSHHVSPHVNVMRFIGYTALFLTPKPCQYDRFHAIFLSAHSKNIAFVRGPLKLLDQSCVRHGLEHVVLTDHASEARVSDAGVPTFASDLPRNLLQATTAAQANWMESDYSKDIDTVFVGADCLVLRDFRPYLRPADFSICTFRHRSLWIMNGFMHVPAHSRSRMIKLFREVALGTRPLEAKTCDDMMSWERVLAPRPKPLVGQHVRRRLNINFLDEPTWCGMPTSVRDKQKGALLLHFRGPRTKAMFFEWADRNIA